MKLIANWKMNGTPELLNSFIDFMDEKDFILALPYSLISLGKYLLKGNSKIAAQDCSIFNGNGAYTGEVSAKMLKECGADYVIIGHSERRKLLNESQEILDIKIENALESGLKVIYCVSEEYEKQLTKKKREVIIAYEPLSAIGTGIIPTLEEIEYVLAKIKKFSNTFENPLYGGSVSSKNIANLSKIKGIGGVLVGGASLKKEELEKMLCYIN